MQQLVLGMLLDDGGRGLARALAGLTTVLVLALFVVILVPIAVVADMGFTPLARAPGAEAVGVPVAVAPTATGGPAPQSLRARRVIQKSFWSGQAKHIRARFR